MNDLSINSHFLEDQVIVINFDIDDQSPEDLAIGIERLSIKDSVLSICQTHGLGKKNRTCIKIEIIIQKNAFTEIINLIFEETSTIGVRWRLENRVLLPRESLSKIINNHPIGFKRSQRGKNIFTNKPDSSDLYSHNYSERLIIRAKISDEN